MYDFDCGLSFLWHFSASFVNYSSIWPFSHTNISTSKTSREKTKNAIKVYIDFVLAIRMECTSKIKHRHNIRFLINLKQIADSIGFQTFYGYTRNNHKKTSRNIFMHFDFCHVSFKFHSIANVIANYFRAWNSWCSPFRYCFICFVTLIVWWHHFVAIQFVSLKRNQLIDSINWSDSRRQYRKSRILFP